MALEKIDKIRRIGKKVTQQIEPNKDHFEALMNQRAVKVDPTQADQKLTTSKVEKTLFDEVRDVNQKANYATRSSPSDLVAQTEDVIAQIDTIKNKLETPDLNLKGSVQTLLRNKLNHIDENLKVALEKAGVEYSPPEKTTSMAKPIERFLGLLTHSQSQLETLATDVRSMALMEKQLSPASMLLIQIKVSYIQQEMELFTSMLNKALESTKTMMNVQV